MTQDYPRPKHRTVGAPDETIRRARQLRREMSLPEVLLWRQLKQRPGGFKFRKQVPAHPYVLDFACLSARLAIEIDGAAHDCGDRPERDARRGALLAARGYRTLRIAARDVLRDLEAVVKHILAHCEKGSRDDEI